MTSSTTSAFDLPARLAAKADPALVAADERHFAAIAHSLEQAIAELAGRLDAARKVPGGTGQAAMDRDLEVHRLTARLRTLRRYGLDLCLGHVVHADDPEPVYVGRLGLTDADGSRLLIDWRTPAAEPFFGATHANPMGLVSRRRYRWTGGRVSDYWDEVFTAEGFEGHAAALDDQSAFIASLGGTRSARMRDVLGTIQADQDAIVRAGSKGALVVDGGPGTGKTVVALHRTAYLLYSDPRLGHRMGGVLFVGPHQPYLAYVSDVLPSLGEEGVQTCTLRDLVPEGAVAPEEGDAGVARLKADARLVAAIEPAVRLYEQPPTEGLEVDTPWGEVWLGSQDWAEAFDAPEPGAAHNESRDLVWDSLVAILVDKLAAEVDEGADADADPGADGATVTVTSSTRTASRRGTRTRGSVGRSPRTPTSWRPSAGRGRCSSRPTSWATCGRCRPTCGCARPGSSATRCCCCSAPPRTPGPCPTCPCSTRPGSGSATRRPHAAARAGLPPRRPSASGWPTSSPTSSRPTTPR